MQIFVLFIPRDNDENDSDATMIVSDGDDEAEHEEEEAFADPQVRVLCLLIVCPMYNACTTQGVAELGCRMVVTLLMQAPLYFAPMMM